MKAKYIPYTLTLSALLWSAGSFAQDKTTEQKKDEKPTGALTEEIVVERPYKPVLADAAKIRRSPDLNTTRSFKTRLNYTILDKKLELNSDIRQLQAQNVAQIPSQPLKNNYAKLGFGNYSTGLAELYLNTGPDEALQAGVFVKHLNQEGSLNKQEFSQQEIGVFGKSVLDKITLNGEVGFDRFSSFFYGLDTSLSSNTNPLKQRYGTINLKGELIKNYSPEATSDYALKTDIYLLSDKYDAKENSVSLSGFYNNVWKQFNVGVNTSVDFTQAKDSLYSISNHIFRANPYIKVQGATYKVAIGVNLVQEFGDVSRFNLFPTITAEIPIVPEFATIFGGYTGDVNKATLREFAKENPYINNNIFYGDDQIALNNELESSYIYGGIKGNAGAGFGYKAMLFYKKLEDMPLFVNNALHPERFDIVYDDSKVTGLEGEINVKVSEAFTWLGKVNINNYSMDTQQKAWFKPNFRLFSNARFTVNKKLTLDGELVLNDQTSALLYNQDPAVAPVVTKIKSYADFSAGAEYVYQEKIGIFLRVNNIFGNKYEKYLFYPKVGLNVIGGLNYSF